MDDSQRNDTPQDDDLKLPEDRVEDLEPEGDDAKKVRGGLLLPAVQKIREAAARIRP